MSIVNFGEETREELRILNYSIKNIAWIGDNRGQYYVDVDAFFTAADNYVYDSGYGFTEVPQDLIIMMKDGTYFYRKEYDGSEWWGYHTNMRKPRYHHRGKIDFNKCRKNYSILLEDMLVGD
jgi:hypothetical protein